MTVFVPSYYPSFSCTAGACRHSCCIGWYIGVDPDSAARFDRFSSPLSDLWHTWKRTDEDGDTYIALTDDGRCPFLNEGGLCRMILTHGDGVLCQICADHPRFRAPFSDRTEMGLGACCEEAARLIVSEQAPVRLIPLGDAANLAPTEEEAAFFKRRERLLDIAQNRTSPIHERLCAVLREVGKERPPLSRRAMAAVYGSLERLDPAWDTVLARLTERSDHAAVPDVFLEQWLVYGLFRHLPDSLTDGRFASRTAMVVHSVYLLEQLSIVGDAAAFAELMRAYSAEAEYSEDNIEQLLETF